jgi:hypothetical protein
MKSSMEINAYFSKNNARNNAISHIVTEIKIGAIEYILKER